VYSSSLSMEATSEAKSVTTLSVASSEPEASTACARGIFKPSKMVAGSEILVMSEPNEDVGITRTT